MPSDAENQVTGQRRVVVAVDDMFFLAKIRASASALGKEIVVARSLEQLDRELCSTPPDLLIIDLNSTRLDPLEAIKSLKSRPELRSTPVVGFLSHVQIDLKRNAEEAGCDQVMPRSAFFQNLPQILSGGR
jgi:CheY-like chemotaxis protein